MRTLTLNSIRQNPWNVLLQKMPPQPGPLLLEAAFMAAEYCYNSDRMLMEAATDGRLRFYVRDTNKIAEAHDECRTWSEAACYKLEEISDLLEQEFGEAQSL
jgi:hypothetical protein